MEQLLAFMDTLQNEGRVSVKCGIRPLLRDYILNNKAMVNQNPTSAPTAWIFRKGVWLERTLPPGDLFDCRVRDEN